MGLCRPIPAWQCELHSARIAAQWWAVSSLFPPSVARGSEKHELETEFPGVNFDDASFSETDQLWSATREPLPELQVTRAARCPRVSMS